MLLLLKLYCVIFHWPASLAEGFLKEISGLRDIYGSPPKPQGLRMPSKKQSLCSSCFNNSRAVIWFRKIQARRLITFRVLQL